MGYLADSTFDTTQAIDNSTNPVTVVVVSVTGGTFVVGDSVKIDDEWMTVTGVS